jgi:hypothetical protein
MLRNARLSQWFSWIYFVSVWWCPDEYRGSNQYCAVLLFGPAYVFCRLQPVVPTKINVRKPGIFGTKKGHINFGGHVLWNPVLVRDSRESVLFLHVPFWFFGPEAWSMNFELNKNKRYQTLYYSILAHVRHFILEKRWLETKALLPSCIIQYSYRPLVSPWGKRLQKWVSVNFWVNGKFVIVLVHKQLDWA